MRERTLILPLTFVLVPAFALACAGGSGGGEADQETDEETGAAYCEDTMEAGDGHVHDWGHGEPDHGGHEHIEGDSGHGDPGHMDGEEHHGEKGHMHRKGDG